MESNPILSTPPSSPEIEELIQNSSTTKPAPLSSSPIPRLSLFKKIFLLIATIIAISVTAAAAYLFYQNQQLNRMATVLPSPTPLPSEVSTKEGDPTVNWQTYSDEEQGFSFKHPNNWTITETNYTGSLSSCKLSSSQYANSSVEILAENSWAGKDNVKDSASNYNIGGIQGYRKSYPGGQNPPAEIVYVEVDEVVLSIILNYEENNKQTLLTLFDQILSTFKFIDNVKLAPTPDPTLDWQTFNGQKLIFKYPSEWIRNGVEITGTNPPIEIVVADSGPNLMNECMHLDLTETRQNILINYFSPANQGEMCSTTDPKKLSERQIWIVSPQDEYMGLQIQYSANDSVQIKTIVDQILSTFQFTN